MKNFTRFFTLLYHHFKFQLQSEQCGRLVSDLFDALKSACNIHWSIALVVLEPQTKASRLTNSAGKNSTQNYSTTLHSISNLQSEQRGGLVLNLFDASNLPVPSVCPWDHWLLWYKQKHLQFLRVKNSASFFHPPLPPLSTTIRASSKVVSRPLWCTESTCTINLSIAALVVE